MSQVQSHFITAGKRSATLLAIALFLITVFALTLTTRNIAQAMVCPAFPVSVATTAGLNNALDCFNNSPAGNYVINVTQSFTLTEATIPITNSMGATLQINGNNHTIDGDDSYRQLTIVTGTVTISDITLQHGRGTADCDGAGSGVDSFLCAGAVKIDKDAIVTLTNSMVFSNTAEFGGGLFNFGGVVMISHSVISDNVASFSGPTAQAQYKGGGIANIANGNQTGILTITHSTIARNRSEIGGGIHNFGNALLTLSQSAVINNVTDDTAGGIENAGTLVMHNSTVSENSAPDGSYGGISSSGSLTITNSTIAFNWANDSFGGLFASIRESDGDTIIIRNTIIANNVTISPTNLFNHDDCITSDGFATGVGDIDETNLMGDSLCGDVTQSDTIYLGPLQDNGGNSWTHAIPAYSSAFNAGDNSVCAADSVHNVDQRGVARPQYGLCDIGAYEFEEINEPVFTNNPNIIVWENQTAAVDILALDDVDGELSGFSFSGIDIDQFNTNETTGLVTFVTEPDFENPADSDKDNVYNFQVAVTDTNGLSTSHDFVITVLDVPECSAFPLQVSNEAELNSAIACFNYMPTGDYTINITADITLTAPLTDITRAGFHQNESPFLTIDGHNHALNGGNLYRIFNISSANVTLADLTLKNGFASDSCIDVFECGGAIFVQSSGVVTLTGSSLISNTASYGGGAVYNAGNMTINSSTFYTNSAPAGGSVVNAGMMTVRSSTFYSNSGQLGGAILNGLVPNEKLSITIINSTLSHNSATIGGSAITGFYGSATIQNSTIYSNSTAGSESAVFNAVSALTMTVRNTIISENTVGGDCSGLNFDIDNSSLDSDGSCDGAVQSASINLGPLQDNGGPAWTHALLEGSSARDAGDNAICAAAPVNNVDQRGIPRPQFATCDIGAFEYWVNSAPSITSSNEISVTEGQTSTIDVDATDDVLTNWYTLTFSLSGGADKALFAIDPATGVVTFINSPDYEAPADVGADNVYNIEVTVTDSGPLTDVQEITITVTDAPENTAPMITSSNSVSVAENQTGVININAADDNDSEGAGLLFSLSGGADQALFAIDSTTGVVTFINAPDYEAPADTGGDNNYNVQVTVTDSGALTAVQDIVITVTDVTEIQSFQLFLPLIISN